MDFEGFRLAMREDVLRIIRDRPTERISHTLYSRECLLISRTSAASSIRNDARARFLYFRLIVTLMAVDIPWEYILRAEAVIDDKDRLILTYINSFPKLKPPEYEPRSYEFILRPASTDPIDYIARVLNFAARRHSRPLSHLHL
jgi:hypothetical protein